MPEAQFAAGGGTARCRFLERYPGRQKIASGSEAGSREGRASSGECSRQAGVVGAEVKRMAKVAMTDRSRQSAAVKIRTIGLTSTCAMQMGRRITCMSLGVPNAHLHNICVYQALNTA